MKRFRLSFLVVVLSAIVLIVSCEDTPVSVSDIVEYSTPTIKGTITIPDGSDVKPDEVYVKVIDSDDKTVTIQKASSDGTFVIQNLSQDMTYKILFTSEEPEFNNRSVTRGKGSGVGGWLKDVVPAVKEGNNVGSVKMKPLGTIKGRAFISGATQHYDITVYIPGTSYSAITDRDGNFSIYSVPEGTYTLRYILDDHVPYMMSNVMLVCPDDVENPEKTVGNVTLYSNKGTVVGRAVLGDASDSTGINIKLESEDKSVSYDSSTSSDGSYTISGVAPGRYRIIASYSTYTPVYTGYFTVETATVTTVNDRLELLGVYGTISGSASLSSSSSGALQILLKRTDGEDSYSVLTGTDGTFTKKVKPGTYTVTASYPDYESRSMTLTVVENGEVRADFIALVSSYGTVTGYSASSGETVNLIDSTGRAVSSVNTADDRSYVLNSVTPGTYSVQFSKTGYASYTVTSVYVTKGGTVSVNGETLKSSYGTISGTSASVGETVSLIRGSSVIYSVTTSSDRNYEFSNLSSGVYSLEFSKDGYSSYETVSYSVEDGSSLIVNGKALTSIYGTVSGKSATNGETVTLLNSKGTPEKTVESGADGSYTFTNISAGTYSVRFSKDGYASYIVSDVSVAVATTTIVNGQALVSSFGKISGTSNSIGETVSLLSNSSTIQSVTTGSDRKYEFSNIAVGTYTLSFTKEGYSAYETTSYTIRNGSNLTVNGIALTSLYGSITGKSSSSGETVTLISSTGASVDTLVTSTDLKYSFDTLLPGTYSVKFSKNGYSSYTATAVVEENKTSTVNGTALVSVYGIISGKSESFGETVYLIKGTQSVKNTTTLESKEYAFTNVEPGEYTVRFAKTDYTSYDSSSITVEAGQSYVIDGERLSAIYGSISGKTAASGEFVSLLNSTGTIMKTVQTSSDCKFSFTRLEPGTYSLSISKEGYFPTTVSDVIVVAGEDNSITTPELVSTNGTVSGFVTLEGNSDNSGVIITLTDSSDSENVYSEVSASDGSFRITGIKKTSNYLLTYSKDGYVSNLSNSVDVTVGKVITADSVTLKSVMSTVSGKIQLEGASSYENTTILLKSGDNDYTATTDQKGEYRINGVLPGTYTLIASKDGYVTASTKEFVVESSSEKEVELLSLSVAVRSVTGKVTLELGTDHAGALVTATNLSDSKIVYSAITNSDGDYTLAGMVPGEYQIVISKSGYVTATLPTTNIVANTLTDVGSTELAIAKGEITGIARLEGCSDYSGITVSIVGTTFSTTTAKDGTYSFTVPTGNYSGGIRYEYEDFETTSYVANIAVLQTTSYSDAYAVPDQELKCINVPKVSGKVSVAGSTKVQYEDITISIVELPEFTFTTESDGKYTFEHVPVGTYTFEFTRENARKVTKMVAIESSLEITIEDIELIPDAVTLYGNISLSGLSDYSGVTVRVTTSDSVELKTVTNAAGYWYIGNIIASKEHTIYFEKSGWATKSYAIAANTYEPMSLNDCTSTYPVVLEDKVSPVITSLTATVGKSTEDGREVYLYLYTQEEGSGIKYIQGNTSDSFDSITEQSYYNPFKLIISDEVGDTTIYVRVKDAAGNISNTVSTNVTLKNDKTELYQTLSGDKLHLKCENSPYVMTDNILVPEGETLVIDPGVEIQVKGEYYIQVEGTLSAVGTEDKHIKIYGVDEGQDKWKGFKIINDNDTQITYTEITGITEGIQGPATIESSIITATSDGYALGYSEYGWSGSWDDVKSMFFDGNVSSSSISGVVLAKPSFVKDSSLMSDKIYIKVKGEIFNTAFTVNSLGQLEGSFVQNTFNGTGELIFTNSYLMNDKIDMYSLIVKDSSTIRYTTINNTSLSIIGGYYNKNSINNCTFNSFSAYRFTSSNIVGCGTLTVSTQRLEREAFDMTGNYWGDDKTVELEQKTSEDKISFLYHYTNDFNLSRVDWDNYSKSALTDCGYQGKDFNNTGSSSEYFIGETGPAGGLIFYDKGYYSDGWRYLEAAPEDLSEEYGFGYFIMQDVPSTKVTLDSSFGCAIVGTSTGIGTGKANTEALVLAMGDTTCMDISIAWDGSKYYTFTYGEKKAYAAKACVDYCYNGFDDWFLPSIDELDLMYVNLEKRGLGTFVDYGNTYWSSSESGSEGANWEGFYSGSQNEISRSAKMLVRSIRSF